jgi:hypothetical protein
MMTCGHFFVLGFANLDDNPINECNITLKRWDMRTKGNLVFFIEGHQIL